MNKYLTVLFSLTFLATGCKSKYNRGFEQGYQQGFDETYQGAFDNGFGDGESAGTQNGFNDGYASGYTQGNERGWSDAFDLYASEDYVNGFNNGNIQGFNQGFIDGGILGTAAGAQDGTTDGSADGYTDGYNFGYSDGSADGYDLGYNTFYTIGFGDGSQDGYNNGYADGYFDGSDDGYQTGYGDYYSIGFSDGEIDGYNYGYDNGFLDGYDYGFDIGYLDGFDDGYNYGLGLSTPSDNPSVRLAASVNSDLIDYSSLPKFDSKKALSNGTIALSHADSGTVDLEKLGALKEQHYLNAMKNQIQARFALSAQSAQRIALVTHQFNKLSGSRELTSEDASSFSKNLIGFDMHEIENAVKKSMSGKSSDLNSLLEKAAGNIGTSPEKFNSMISEIFY